MTLDGAGTELAERAPAPDPAWRRWVPLLVVLGAAAATYANAVPSDFVWDDTHIIVENPATRHVSGVGELVLSPDVVKPYYRPLNRASYLLDYQLFGMRGWGFHLVNVALHLVNVVLLYRLALALFRGRRELAVVAALLFAVHPIGAECVDFISARNNLLALAFSLGSAILLLDGFAGGLRWRAPLSAACWFLALLSKESAAAAAGVNVLLALAPATPSPYSRARRLAVTLLPLAGFAAVYAVLRRAALGDVVGAGLGLGGLARAAQINYQVVPRYAELIVFPARLSLFRSVPEEGVASAPWLLVAWVAIALAIALVVWRGSYAARLGLVWLAVNYAPISNLVPIPSAAMAERYLYLPAVGIWLIAADAAGFVARTRLRRYAGALVAAIAIALAARTAARNLDWRDEVSLFSATVRAEPQSATSHFNLGCALRDRGDLAGAERSWARTLALDPRHAGALVQMGTLAATRGDLAGAERSYREALRSEPANPMGLFNLARVLERTGRPGEAIAAYSRFLDGSAPEYAELVPVAMERRAALTSRQHPQGDGLDALR